MGMKYKKRMPKNTNAILSASVVGVSIVRESSWSWLVK